MTGAPDVALDIDTALPIVAGVFAEHAAINRLPSLAWGVVDHGELVASANELSVYRIASMTKSFTCAAVLTLRDEGRIALDDPIARHAPELARVAGPTTDSPAITVRHLMTMSSGLATDDAWADRHLDVTDEELDRWLGPGAAFAAAPGTMFEYSNLGFGLLGRVVQHATGASVQQLVTERLVVPLGLRDTSWVEPRGAVVGYRADGDSGIEPALGDGAIAPMGGLFTTVADLARWVGFLGDAFPARDDPDDAPLSRASRREMQQVQRAFAPRTVVARDGRVRTVAGGYGLGLNVLHHDGLGWVVSHSGGLPGYGSNMRWVPGVGIGLIALANATYAPMAEATAAVLDALHGAGLVHASRPPVTPAVRAAADALSALHERWDDVTATTLFADNIAPDIPLVDRRATAERLREEHGPLRLARIEAQSATAAIAVLHGPASEVRIEFQLAPIAPPRVQWYEAAATA